MRSSDDVEHAWVAHLLGEAALEEEDPEEGEQVGYDDALQESLEDEQKGQACRFRATFMVLNKAS